MKEIKFNLQNKHAAAHWCCQGGGAGQEAKLSLWAEFRPFPCLDHRWWIEKYRHSYETFVKNAKDMKTHHQIILAAACCCWQGGGVGRGGDNSVGGLSFGCSHGRTIAVQLEKNWDVAKRHRQNVVASVSLALLCATAWWQILKYYHACSYYQYYIKITLSSIVS